MWARLLTQHVPASGPTKLFLLISGDFPDDEVPAGFIYKRNFQIRMQKGLQVRAAAAHLCIGTMHDLPITRASPAFAPAHLVLIKQYGVCVLDQTLEGNAGTAY